MGTLAQTRLYAADEYNDDILSPLNLYAAE